MPNQFLLIIKKTDEEKFRLFKIPKYNKQANEILKKNDSKYVWGLHKGTISDKIWNKIKKNDKIYLTVEEEPFKISGNVFKKIKNLKYGEVIYPNEIDKKQINYFIFFEKLDSCREPFKVLKKKSKSRIFSNEGIFEMKVESPPKKIKMIKIKKLPIEKNIAKAEKRRRKASQILARNSTRVKNLKEFYNNECQIEQCDFKLNYEKNGKIKPYSHVHHYNQLSKSLIDSLNNMIVLCPNHHAEFDFKVKLVHYDGKTIIDRKGKETGETIKFRGDHKLDIKNIESLLGE